MKNQLTLLHFENPDDLLAGIDTLQQHNIVIREIYASAPVPNLEIKLRIKQLQFGKTIFRFGCLGGMGLTSLSYYLLALHSDWKTALLNILILLVTLLIAGCLFPTDAPRVFTLKPGDRRYLAVVDTRHIPVNGSIAHFFQYTGAVEVSPAIKNILIS
ncbi:MAG TPA: quinol:electron acceptor oxidoreductase subunit ActD [Mucilaginibacter sp.]|nr:quinol:electron acceptor oxidoreductase subunit ActD [Mucilaginibacter sp.]